MTPRRPRSPRPRSDDVDSHRPTAPEVSDRTPVFVVDRREGVYLVMVDEAGHAVDAPADALPTACRDLGAVLRVPRGDDGRLQWSAATRDRDEERRRTQEAAERLERLRRTDPGGDVVL